jgi:hypothetical protein
MSESAETTLEEVVEELKRYFNYVECPMGYLDDPDFNPYEYSGGNFDDAFHLGYSEGRRCMANEVREILGVPVLQSFLELEND